MCEVSPAAADFPNAFVRLLPDGLEVFEHIALDVPCGVLRGKPIYAPLEQGVQNLPIDVELQLSGGGVADAHGLGSLIPGKPRYLPFVETPLAQEAIHDLHLSWVTCHGAPQPLAPSVGLVQET